MQVVTVRFLAGEFDLMMPRLNALPARLILICLIMGGLFVSLVAQDVDGEEEDERIPVGYGEVAVGQINALTPRVTYVFEALRCDFISIHLIRTNGTLDPVIAILDDEGRLVFNQDDSGGELGIDYDSFPIPHSGQYTVVLGRFGYGLGSTYGGYELLIERVGNSSANGCGLRYGDSVINIVDSTTPEVFYLFRAHEGDIINIRMQQRSGDLDPYLRVVNSANIVIAENDDTPILLDTSGDSQDAEIPAMLIPQDGTYYIIASRYGVEAGVSSGSFMLTLEETDESGLGNSPVAPNAIRLGARVEDTLTDEQFIHYYRFEAEQNDLISISMDQVSGSIDAYLILANSALQQLFANDDSNETQNSLISQYLIPETGTYYIVATRFEREEGRTTGSYRLELTDHGNAFDGVPEDVRRVDYGTSLSGRIDDITPQIRYAFRAEEGDVIRVSMNQGDGDLDPLINILSESGRVMFSDDDTGGNQNALIAQYTIPYTGVFYVEATRYAGSDNPNTAGSFTLVLAQRMDQ
jgi:hypothetical protein